jgi:hypothetical protein
VHLMCSAGLTKHLRDERFAVVLGSISNAMKAC